MQYHSLLSESQVYLAAAALASQFTFPKGFRQRDTKFFFDLCLNWAESHHVRSEFMLMNNQMKRYLDFLCVEGLCSRKVRESSPLYGLTRAGIIELLNRIRSAGHTLNRQRFLFVFYFLKTYREALCKLASADGRPFPPAIKIELEQLLDVSSLLQHEIGLVQAELRVLQRRIEDAHATSKLVRKLKSAGKEHPEIILEVQKNFPYELNSQKPLSELVASLPEEAQIWELEVGPVARVQCIWQPTMDMLKEYLLELNKLPVES